MKKLMKVLAAALLAFVFASCPTGDDDLQGTATVPSEVTARAQSSSTIYISWTGIVNADYYTVYRVSNAGNQQFDVFNAYDYTDTNLAPDIQYNYQVSATKGGVEGAKSKTTPAKTFTQGSAPVPEKVTGVTATVDGSSVAIAWEAVSGATYYIVERGASSSGPWANVYDGSSAACTDSGLKAGTWYYHVAAANTSGTGPWSETRIAAVGGGSGSGDGSGTGTGDGQPAATVPQAPAGLSVTAKTQNSLTLSWQAVSGAQGYRVSRSGAALQTTVSTSYTDTGLAPGTTYQYQVRAYNGQGDGSPASTSGTTTTASSDGTIIPPPAKPTGLVVSSPAAGSITISWNGVTADSYEIWRSNTSSSAPSRIGTSTGTSYTDYSAPPGTTNYYSVKAVNSSGTGSSSDKAFAYAAAHFTLPAYSGSYTLNLPAKGKHYYRLAVTAGQSYTITWDDGNNADLDYYSYVRCGAWQNDGTGIFANAYSGRSSPKPFTATAAGYVTVEIQNTSSSTSCDYRIYYH